MLKMILVVFGSVWATSSLFMLIFYLNTQIQAMREGRVLHMPFLFFLYVHFCPIVHTVKTFKILNRIATLKAQAEERGR